MKPITAAKLLKLEVAAHADDNDDLLSLIEEVRAYRLSGAKIDPVAARLAASVDTPTTVYILNPGDGCDVETFEHLPVYNKRSGALYRVAGHRFEHFDRHTGNWYEYDREAQGGVPIKVLRAAGLCS